MSGHLVFDLSDDSHCCQCGLEELKKQINEVAEKKRDEAEALIYKGFNSSRQWKYGYHTACLDVIRGIEQILEDETHG